MVNMYCMYLRLMFTEHKTIVAMLLVALFLSSFSVLSQAQCELNSVPALDIISSVHFLMVKGNLPNCIGASYIESRFVGSKNGYRKRS